MLHRSHEHPLILNTIYIARDGDMCHGCGEQILSSKSFVYSCSHITGDSTITGTGTGGTGVDNKSCARFLLHKNCAELPYVIRNPTNLKGLFKLCFDHSDHPEINFNIYLSGIIGICHICKKQIPQFPELFFYHGNDFKSFICLICVMYHTQLSSEDHKSMHPSHGQHLLSLIQHPSSFRCYACNVNDNIIDMSYRCTKCQFWIRKSCADAPASFQFKFHDKHPLALSFSLPPLYHKFQQYCRLCNKTLSPVAWIYYCRYCRFFAHFHCARYGRLLSSGENERYEDDVLQLLPAADELSVQLLREKYIKAASIPYYSNTDSIFIWVNKYKYYMTHQGHDHLQLINGDELQNDQIDDILLCDGCTQPIRTDHFYGCASCKYYLHKFCAEFPTDIKIDAGHVTARIHKELYKLFFCGGCRHSGNGIYLDRGLDKYHIGCLTLPKIIKHEAHRHKLNLMMDALFPRTRCNGCEREVKTKHGCTECEYYICGSCIMKANVVEHPWDSHSLHLIYEPGMVIDHEHDFNCEFCSEDINSNFWFYHCSTCDRPFVSSPML